MLKKIGVDQMQIVFMWVLGHVGIQGNEAADRVLKKLLTKTLQLISSHSAEWDKTVLVSNKLDEILPEPSNKRLSFF